MPAGFGTTELLVGLEVIDLYLGGATLQWVAAAFKAAQPWAGERSGSAGGSVADNG